MTVSLRQHYGREAVKLLLRPLLHWEPLHAPRPGYSIVLGVPWNLRHLLGVNLRFVAQLDLTGLHALHVVFDRRRRPEAEALVRAVRTAHPVLPLRFHFYDETLGKIVERAHSSNFYNATNLYTALRECETTYAILHDFDLYPLRKSYFRDIHEFMASNALRFSGVELTSVEGLTREDHSIGTWGLGIDVAWLRSTYAPIAIYHRTSRVRGVQRHLDPFSWIQLRTPERRVLPHVDESDFLHVRNLPSTHLEITKGRKPGLAWRIHYLWYLEYLAGSANRLTEVTRKMEDAQDRTVTIDARALDFSAVDPTCANVLETDVGRMERFLFGTVRGEVASYLEASASFLGRGK